MIRTLHPRGVKGFVTFNTLVFEHELARGCTGHRGNRRSRRRRHHRAGCRSRCRWRTRSRRISRSTRSTQMSITSAEGVRFAQQLGAIAGDVGARTVAGRDPRDPRSRRIATWRSSFMARLCVAYSGQCFSSEAWGGRSANRGQCAQACRLPYELIVDEELRPLDDARYLLSPGDLYALHHVPEIVDIGISALKIEGRYKDADYVALATRAYRKAVDEAVAGRALQITPAEELQLEQVYSRGLGAHFIVGDESSDRGQWPRAPPSRRADRTCRARW